MNDIITLVSDSEVLTELIGEGQELETLSDACGFTEGPIWNISEQAFYFSDLVMDMRRRWTRQDGMSVVRTPNAKGNGMTLTAEGAVLVCHHATSVVVIERGDKAEVIASHWQGKELNSPNDIAYRSDGNIYFSDPSYGRGAKFGIERPRQLDFQGVFRIAPDGGLHLERADFEQPNGLCFSPDEKVLYINDTARALLRKFIVNDDGSLGAGTEFAAGIRDTAHPGLVDGLKCDEFGNVYVTGPFGLWVFDPQGKRLGIVNIPQKTSNFTWGGAEYREIFCASGSHIFRFDVNIRGAMTPYVKEFIS